MILFEKFEAVKFPEENLICIVNHYGYLQYVYNCEHKTWEKYSNARNDRLTISNYPDMSKEELISAMNGIFPNKETDFMRLCPIWTLGIGDMLELLREDYPDYLSHHGIDCAIDSFLVESYNIAESYKKIRELLDKAIKENLDDMIVLSKIMDLSFSVIGIDIFKREIGIVDGHDSSSYFWIMPVRIIDNTNTNDIFSVAEMRSSEISIEEDDVSEYLYPFLAKHFDMNLEANKKRVAEYWEDQDGVEHVDYVEGFEWYLTYNFYTFESMRNMLHDIYDTIDALSTGRENYYTGKLRKKTMLFPIDYLFLKDLSTENYEACIKNRQANDNEKIDILIDFYKRFTYRIEYMIKVGEEKGYNLISFMGP